MKSQNEQVSVHFVCSEKRLLRKSIYKQKQICKFTNFRENDRTFGVPRDLKQKKTKEFA